MPGSLPLSPQILSTGPGSWLPILTLCLLSSLFYSELWPLYYKDAPDGLLHPISTENSSQRSPSVPRQVWILLSLFLQVSVPEAGRLPLTPASAAPCAVPVTALPDCLP